MECVKYYKVKSMPYPIVVEHIGMVEEEINASAKESGWIEITENEFNRLNEEYYRLTKSRKYRLAVNKKMKARRVVRRTEGQIRKGELNYAGGYDLVDIANKSDEEIAEIERQLSEEQERRRIKRESLKEKYKEIDRKEKEKRERGKA